MCNNVFEIPKPLTAINGAKRRSFLLETRSLPTQTEVRREMGPKMADVFFEDLSLEGKIWLGLIPPLDGPDELWIDPDSRLEGMAKMTPVPEPKDIILKALCHKNILEIGENVIQKIEEMHKRYVEEALKFQALELEEECMSRVQDEAEKWKEKGEDYCQEVVGTLMEHFEQCFKELEEATELKMLNECKLLIKEEKEELAAFMFDEMQKEMQRHEAGLIRSFDEYLRHELNNLELKHFKQIKAERNIAIVALRETIQKYEKMLSSLRTEMEASSVVDICRAINYERQQCNEYARLLERTMQLKIDELQDSIKKLKSRYAELLGSSNSKESVDEEKIRQNWKQNFQDVICEFQRFINFALKSAPAHAEYLLNPKKLMENFPEFTESISVKKPRQFSSLSDERKHSRIQSKASTAEPVKATKPPRDNKCAFDYHTFKRLISGERPKLSKKKRGTVTASKKEKPIDRTSSFYNLLTIVGEHEKSHMVPVEEFVDSRIVNLYKICQKNPEVAKMMLGCP